jgi:MHS family proline/betaine transporter-like MFS transporter
MDSRSRLRLIAAGAIGNMLEWYDFAIYGYFRRLDRPHVFSIG